MLHNLAGSSGCFLAHRFAVGHPIPRIIDLSVWVYNTGD